VADDRSGMPAETLTETLPVLRGLGRLDLRGWTITTAVAFAAHEALAGLAVGEELGRIVVRKGGPLRADERVAIVASGDGLDELLSSLGFALAGAQVERRRFR
jgi:hypothetical protein